MTAVSVSTKPVSSHGRKPGPAEGESKGDGGTQHKLDKTHRTLAGDVQSLWLCMCSATIECTLPSWRMDVKVLPRHQAQHEAGILHSRAPHPKPRAIALPCELALPGDAVAFGHALGTAPPVRQRNRGNGAPSVVAAVRGTMYCAAGCIMAPRTIRYCTS